MAKEDNLQKSLEEDISDDVFPGQTYTKRTNDFISVLTDVVGYMGLIGKCHLIESRL